MSGRVERANAASSAGEGRLKNTQAGIIRGSQCVPRPAASTQ